jgi:hypothetical protein
LIEFEVWLWWLVKLAVVVFGSAQIRLFDCIDWVQHRSIKESGFRAGSVLIALIEWSPFNHGARPCLAARV